MKHNINTYNVTKPTFDRIVESTFKLVEDAETGTFKLKNETTGVTFAPSFASQERAEAWISNMGWNIEH